MTRREITRRSIIIGFFVLIGFALAKAIFYNSFIGIVLALVSLGAAIYFLYILSKARRELTALQAGGEGE
ncbi:MAG: hypothetical protein ACXWV1_13065 [Chitinophagaceae bacterium]